MNKKWLRFIVALAVLATAGAGAVMWAVKPAAAPVANDGRLRVVAAENFWGDIAAQVGGSNVSVSSLISDPGVDPHLFEADARAAAAVGAADVVVYNGLGYDNFMTKLLAAAPNQARRAVSAAEASHASAEANPHLWYDISKVRQTAEAAAEAFSAKDPSHAPAYRENLRHLEIDLKAVSAAQSKIASFYSGTPVAYTERVPEYLLRDTGLNVVSPEGFARAIEDGNEPSPADTAAMRQLVTSKAVRILLYNSQAGSAVTEQIKALARQSGVPVVGVTETMPTDQPNFQTWQLAQIRQISEVLNAD